MQKLNVKTQPRHLLILATCGLAITFSRVLLPAQKGVNQTSPAERVKVVYTTVSIFPDPTGKSGQLSSVSFTIQNLADQPLVWVRIRATIRNYVGELIHTETFEHELSSSPLGPKEARQITHYIGIRGFLIDGRRGSVDIQVTDFRHQGKRRGVNEQAQDRDSPKTLGPESPAGEGLAYRDQILELIRTRWVWAGKKTDLEVTVRFSILHSGQIGALRIVRESGDASYDDSVLRALLRTSPLPPPPGGAMDLEVTFRP